jgi:hypothetical protein
MCILSDKIKFCTCPSDMNVEELPQYWVLNRYNPAKQTVVIGSAMLPTSLRDLSFNENRSLILTALNSGVAFDKEIEFQPKDCLEVVLSNQPSSAETFVYMFEFKNKKWVPVEKDVFKLQNESDEVLKGYFKYL